MLVGCRPITSGDAWVFHLFLKIDLLQRDPSSIMFILACQLALFLASVRLVFASHMARILQDNQTPLHLAAEEGHLPCVQLLMEKGAAVKAKNKVKLCSYLPTYSCRVQVDQTPNQ
jgi:hypothetical protein